ncbi:hypothetical protein [Rathayibacter toxicus]|uniref:hypothetical protein n=1 Tax=Rathayibacter toxicus TaxID=145458 RepID=UPI0011B09E10|nr:hypothetical protein [Rathayibacter toxicus]QOD09890.1 hypothetical protein BSG36_08090 [Rathayibacter toxicus]
MISQLLVPLLLLLPGTPVVHGDLVENCRWLLLRQSGGEPLKGLFRDCRLEVTGLAAGVSRINNRSTGLFGRINQRRPAADSAAFSAGASV